MVNVAMPPFMSDFVIKTLSRFSYTSSIASIKIAQHITGYDTVLREFFELWARVVYLVNWERKNKGVLPFDLRSITTNELRNGIQKYYLHTFRANLCHECLIRCVSQLL